MKVALIHGRYFNSWEALGLGYLAGFLRRHVPEVKLSFFQGCFDADEDVVAGCADADVIGFSCNTPTFPHARALGQRIKAVNPGAWIVAGGYHPSADPASVPEMDALVVGEGEEALLRIVRGNRDPVVHGRPMSFDELPWPDRELIRCERNIQVAYRDNGLRITSFQSHRGCPFRCQFCLDGFNKVLYSGAAKAAVRYRDPAELVGEMARVAQDYRLDLAKFSDPTWNTSLDWVLAFCQEKLRRRLALPFYPNIHAGICTPEMMQSMRRAGCHQIAVGVESGSPRILKQIGKGTTLESLRHCVAWAKRAGLRIRGYFILGMPEETHEDLALTEALAEELDLDEYGFSILCPYPGTAMYDPARHGHIRWELADEYGNDFWCTAYLSNSEIKAWQRRLSAKFATRLTWHNTVLNQPASSAPALV